jgi:hypothetical protein
VTDSIIIKVTDSSIIKVTDSINWSLW